MISTKEHIAQSPDSFSPGSNLKVLLSGGGTGGHLYPALAIAGLIREQFPGSEVLFVGANGRMEMEKVPAQNFRIEGLPIKGIDRKNILKNIDLPFRLIYCLFRSRSIIQSFKPDIVIGTGGYASGPVAYMAARKNIPVLLQEQNFYPGLTTRILAPYAKTICVAFEGMEKWLPQNKLKITGNPVRKDLADKYADQSEALNRFSLSPDKKTLLVLGGSGGAPAINEAVMNNLPKLMENDVQILWQSGANYYEPAKEKLSSFENTGNVCLQPFIEDMAAAYKAANLVACRAGAITIAELEICEKPAILIPSPNVAADHQTKNAEALKEQNAAMLIPDNEVKNKLGEEVIQLLKDENRMNEMAENMKRMAKPSAAEDIVSEIVKLAGKK